MLLHVPCTSLCVHSVICRYFGAPHEESCAYDDPSIASSAAERDFQMVPSSPSLKRLCTSAEGAWLGVKQPTHAAPNSLLEPSLQQLPLEDAPSQLDDNWALFSAPQEGIKWESGDPFLQTCAEGHEPHLNVGSGCGPVAGPQGAHTQTSFVVDRVLPPWEPRSCEDPSLPPVSFDALPASQLEEGEGEDVLQQQSRNTDQVSLTCIVSLVRCPAKRVCHVCILGCVYASICYQGVI